MQRLLVVPFLVAACSAQFLFAPVGWNGIGSPIIGSPLVRTVVSSPGLVSSPVVSPIAVPITSSQYHAQDELGQFAFGHSSINQARQEVKSFDGTVRGAYSYVDPTGKLNNVQYLADSNGFQVVGANNLPVAPEAVLEPVKDTPEVLEARANFAKAFKEAQEAAEPKKPEEEAKSRSRRQVIYSPLISTLSAKTILKTSELKPIDDAKVPAATKLAEIKETEKEIVTPLTYSSVISSPIFASSLIAPRAIVAQPTIVASPLLARTVVPAVAKATITTQELKTVDDAKTPAATKLAEIKEEKKEVVAPIAYSSPLVASPYISSPWISSPYIGSAITW